MRACTPLIATLLGCALSACGGSAEHFEADFAAAKANAATLEGGAFDHQVGQLLSTPELVAAAHKCSTDHPSDRAITRGVLEFEKGNTYSIRLEDDDDRARCWIALYEGRKLPEPPERPYLLPIELGETP